MRESTNGLAAVSCGLPGMNGACSHKARRVPVESAPPTLTQLSEYGMEGKGLGLPPMKGSLAMQTIDKHVSPQDADQRLRLRVGATLLCAIVLVQALSAVLVLH